MKNKIPTFILIILIPFMAACQTGDKIKYEVKKIDSTSLFNYYLITVTKSNDSLRIASKKENYQSENYQIISVGQKLVLSLNKISSLNESGSNIRIGNGYFIDGKPVIYKGEKIYSAKEITGLYYKNK